MKNRGLKDGRKQRGVAALEFAFILPFLVLLLAVTLFFGRLFWHYTVAQKAAHDAAVILANATKLEIGTTKSDLGDVEVANLAKAVAAEEIAELNPGGTRPRIDVVCGYSGGPCVGAAVPGQVGVLITIRVLDIFLGGLTEEFGGRDGLLLTVDVRMPYVGS
jgi:hypothetical protein